jgi:3-oxoacyl-[acyl-carrier protein] reductase
MLLENKNAVIYGGGGAIGGGVARTFAGEGARVFLAGRTRGPLEAVAAEIEASGGSAEVAELDEQAVDEHAVLYPPWQVVSTSPSTSFRAGTCRGYRWST